MREGIALSSSHNGLLSIDAKLLSNIIKNDLITNVYDVEQTPFARGKFAAVRKCTHKVTGVEYAAKFIRKRRRSMDTRHDIIHEVAVLCLAEMSSRIVALHEVYETPTDMALVLELVPGGELQRVVDSQDGLEEREVIRIMRQILEGLIFLHDMNIAHLDLKPQNLLLTADYPECDIKLCDFGISRIIQSGIEVREILGTPDFVAPEILNYEPISLGTDVWSLGILAYVLLSGHSPFAGDTKQETFCNISQCNLDFPDYLFSSVSQAAKDFICATLVPEPGSRLTAQQCLSHLWLSTCPPPVDHLPPSPITSQSNNTSSEEASSRLPSVTTSAVPRPPVSYQRSSCVAKCGAQCGCNHTKEKHSSVASLPVVESILDSRSIIC